MRRFLFVLATAVAMGSGAVATTIGQHETLNQSPGQEPPVAGIHWARGVAPPASGSPDLIYHGGPVMTQGAVVEAIFWGAQWADPSFVGDKMSGLQTFYGGLGGSTYEFTTTEYNDASGHVGSAVTYATHLDLSSPPHKVGNRTSPILNEVCSQATNLMTDGFYPVYVATPRGHAGFCAWHSAGMCPNGVTVQFAFFFNHDGDPGCDPQDTSGQHSQGLAALANVSGHELSEALTDPHLNAWFDSSGAENADKCAWSFGTPLLSFPNGSEWKIQGNWSNRAFDTGTGYPNRSGQIGCIDGGNFK